MQRIKIHLTKQKQKKSRSHHSDNKHTEKQSEMESMCVLCSDSASTSNHFYAHWQWPLDKTLAEPRIQPWWMKTVTNYWILSFHCTVNQKQWQTRNSCDELLVQSQPAVPEGNRCPDWPAERLLTHKSSVLTETAHKQPTRPPRPHLTKTMTDIFKLKE